MAFHLGKIGQTAAPDIGGALGRSGGNGVINGHGGRAFIGYHSGKRLRRRAADFIPFFGEGFAVDFADLLFRYEHKAVLRVCGKVVIRRGMGVFLIKRAGKGGAPLGNKGFVFKICTHFRGDCAANIVVGADFINFLGCKVVNSEALFRKAFCLFRQSFALRWAFCGALGALRRKFASCGVLLRFLRKRGHRNKKHCRKGYGKGYCAGFHFFHPSFCILLFGTGYAKGAEKMRVLFGTRFLYAIFLRRRCV